MQLDIGLPIPLAVQPGTIEAFGLYAVRTTGLLLTAPLFGGRFGFPGIKIAMVMSVSLAIFLATGGLERGPQLVGLPAAAFGLMATRELVLGVFLGFLLQLAMLAARAAGEAISLEMGITMAAQVDPDSGASSPLLARFYEEAFLVALFSVGGHHEILRALSDSFARAPIGVAQLDGGLGEIASRMMSEMFAAGLAFAAPVMILMAMVSVGLGLIARTVPQVNVLEMGFTLRIGVALVALLALTPLIEPAFTNLFAALREWLATGLDAIGTV